MKAPGGTGTELNNQNKSATSSQHQGPLRISVSNYNQDDGVGEPVVDKTSRHSRSGSSFRHQQLSCTKHPRPNRARVSLAFRRPDLFADLSISEPPSQAEVRFKKC
jgi:hypothetical protein